MQNTSLLSLLIFFLSMLLSCTSQKENENKAPVIENNYYQEEHRPQLHFSPESAWMNDPNGMVFFEDEYHLFYQYYPDSTVWGPMHWGHAVSADLVHWEHLPVALYPDSLGYIFSGSAVVDWKNTSGFGINDQAPLVAIFTHHEENMAKAGSELFQYQSIAYSNDKGRTWTKYAGNPVVPNPGIRDFRDPKVFWHETTQKWVMVLAAYDKVMLYNSPNLKDWTFTSEFGIPGDKRLWECPDLFPLKVEGTEENKWVMIVSMQQQGPNDGTATSYFIGDFDGKTFQGNPQEQFWADFGRDNYAMVTWSDIPASDGRRLAMGWMSNWQYAQIVPTEKWRSAMTIARALKLRNTPDGLRLVSLPVKELQKLRVDTFALKPQTVTDFLSLNEQMPLSGSLFEIELELMTGAEGNFGILLSNSFGEEYHLGYDGGNNEFYSDRIKAGKVDFSEDFAKQAHTAPRFREDRNIKMHLFFDLASAELFADNGEVVLTDIFFPAERFTNIQFYSNSAVEIKSGTVYSLKSIWNSDKN